MAYEVPSYMEYFHFEPLGYVQARGGERRYVFRTDRDTLFTGLSCWHHWEGCWA